MRIGYPVFVQKLHLNANVTAESFKLLLVVLVLLLSIVQLLCSSSITDAWCRLQYLEVRPIRIVLHPVDKNTTSLVVIRVLSSALEFGPDHGRTVECQLHLITQADTGHDTGTDRK